MPVAFPITPIDPKSPIPLYFQVESALRHLIETGQLSAGEVIPPEEDLCRSYKVSRQTMRTALSRMVADDLITRKPGRGTIVTLQADRMKFYLDRSFTQQMVEIGRVAHSRVIDHRLDRINKQDSDVLQPYRDSACFKLERLRLGDAEPVGIQSSTILTAKCPGIEKFDFETSSLYDVLIRTYNLTIHEIRHTVTATVASTREALLLNIDEGMPLLVVYTTALLKNQEIIEYTTSLYRTEYYEYSTHHFL
ncbi:MAG: GntR family transcriptional regulator [Rhodothermales bacterium]